MKPKNKASSLDSFPEKGRLGVVFPLPPHWGGTFCEAKGGGVWVGGLRSKKAFTLVELIIVITILAILATIAFMSFQGYAKQSRDSNRLATMKNIEKWLTIFQTKSWVYPQTESWVLITASGTTIWNQWFVWDGVVRAINMNQIPLDPVDNARYVYSTNEPKTKYQLMTFMEWENNLVSFLPQSFASDLTDRFPLTIWDSLGIVLNQDNSLPINTVNASSWSTNYKVVFWKNNEVMGSWNILSVIQAQRWDKTLASLDESLVGYWDMETTIQSGGITLLKDFSSKKINLDFQNSAVLANEWLIWKALYFNGIRNTNTGAIGFWVDNNRFWSWFTLIMNIKNQQFNNREQPFNSRMFWWHMTGDTSIAYRGTRWLSRFMEDWLTMPNLYDNKYHQYAFWFWNDGIINIYVDGKKLYSRWITLINGTWISSWYSFWHQLFIWYIDESRIYNRALSDSEIKSLYQATK